MSAKVTIYYEHPEELRQILLRLADISKQPRLCPAKGKHMRAYLDVRPILKEPETRKE